MQINSFYIPSAVKFSHSNTSKSIESSIDVYKHTYIHTYSTYMQAYLSLHDPLEIFVRTFDERAIAQLDYGCSLEVSEVVRLRNGNACILPVELL